MKIINIMNFVRQCDPRMEDSERILYETTAAEVALVKEYGLDSTFLLQYDAAIDPGYQELFRREADSHMELGLWYEIVQPLTQKAGIPWRGREGWPWDWHVIPGFSMAYTVEERKKLIDIAMEDFRAIIGEYPKTVASWLLDSYTVNYLADNYPVKAFAICRDQTNTDAYTLVGGYFNQAYYPSRRSMFTPAQSAEQQVNVPMFRLLGPDPIHNYDGERYMTNEKYLPYHGCCTLEPIWESGSNPETVDWFFRNYFRNEDLGFSYAQLGQENSFGPDLLPGLRMQFEKLKSWPDLCVWKMGETGEWFRKTYPDGTPATSVSALDDWDGTDRIQSVYYDCKNYVANLFRCDGKVFLRCLYCFDEDAPERYLDRPCETWDATYENLPVVDTLLWEGNQGLVLDLQGMPLCVAKAGDGCLTVSWGDRQVIFTEEGIRIRGIRELFLDAKGCPAQPSCREDRICYRYGEREYALCAAGGTAVPKDSGFRILSSGEELTLFLARR